MNLSTFGALSPPKPYSHFKGPQTPEALDVFLKEKFPRWLVEFGAVYVNKNRVVDASLVVGPKDVVRVHTNPKRYEMNKGNIQSRIIFQTDNFIIVDKPSGLPMHPTLDNLYENLLYAFDVPVYVTHRLDVPTSGLVLVAKTKSYQTQFNKLISSRRVQKIYEARVIKKVEPQKLVHYMKNTVKAPKVFSRQIEAVEDGETWLECRLMVHSCDEDDNGTFKLQIELLTGRTHQIRGQLAFEGAPIVGDEMYGGKPAPIFGLRASKLLFDCPVSGQKMSFELDCARLG